METVLNTRTDFSAFAAVASGSAEPRPEVGPVTLPSYLDWPQIVMSDRANELNLAEFDQWAESLQTNFTRVLGEHLSWVSICRPFMTDHIALHPWPRSTQVDYQMEVNVVQFDVPRPAPALW